VYHLLDTIDDLHVLFDELPFVPIKSEPEGREPPRMSQVQLSDLFLSSMEVAARNRQWATRDSRNMLVVSTERHALRILQLDRCDFLDLHTCPNSISLSFAASG